MSGFPLAPLGTLISSPITDGPHKTPEFLSEGIPFLSVDGIQHGELVFDNCRFISPEDHEEFSKKAKPQKGDILMGKAASTGKIALVRTEFEFNIWSPLAIIRPNGVVISDFLAYALKSIPAQIQIDHLCSYNTQKNIAMSDIPRIRIPLPNQNTQQRIVDYLDLETAEIDAAVTELDRYMGLLRKRRRAIAVSAIFPHGFPANLLSAQSFLDLGYEAVIRMDSFAKLRRVPNTDQNAQYLSLMKGIGVIPYEEKGNVGNKKPQDLSNTFVVEAGDYLVNSMNFKIGSFGRSRYDGVASGAYLIFSIDNKLVNPDFLQYVFENDDLRAQAQNLGNGILEHRKSINWDRFRSIFLPCPSREKQDAVVEFLNKETAEIDELLAESTKLRDLLVKRRSVLITEVVTGRKEV